MLFYLGCQHEKKLEKRSTFVPTKKQIEVHKVDDFSVQTFFNVIEGCEVFNYTEISRYECIIQRPFTLDWELCVSKYSQKKAKSDSASYVKSQERKTCQKFKHEKRDACLKAIKQKYPRCASVIERQKNGFSIKKSCMESQSSYIRTCLSELDIDNTVEFKRPKNNSNGPKIASCSRVSKSDRCRNLKIEVDTYCF